MGRRIYTAGFNGVTVSAVQDALALFAGASMAFEVHSVVLGQVTQASAGFARLRLRRLGAVVSQGTGGAAVTPVKGSSGDVAATVVARANDTGQATTSGAAEDIPDTWQLLNGYLYLPPVDDRLIIKPGEAFIVSLDTALSSLVCSGNVTFAELW